MTKKATHAPPMSGASRLNTWLNQHVAHSFKRPWLMLLLFACVELSALAVASTLGFKGDFIELLPKDSEEVKDLRFVEQRAGGGGYLVTQITGGTAEQRRAMGLQLAAELERHQELVRYVEARFDMAFFQERALLLLPTDKLKALNRDLAARIGWEKLHANPLYVDLMDEPEPPSFAEIEKRYGEDAPRGEYVESKDGEELYLYVKPSGLPGDLDFNRRLLAMAKDAAADVGTHYPALKVQFTGAYVIRIEEDEVMQNDLSTAGIVAFVVALLIILLATRKPVAVVVVAIPVSLGIAVTFAFAKISVGHLNPVTGFLGAILVGLGIEYGVHLSMRYWEERDRLAPLEAMSAAVTGTFVGAFTSAATNAAAFFVLMFAEFEAFKQFGRIAGFGVLATLFAAYLTGPSILFIAERIRPMKIHIEPETQAQREGHTLHPRTSFILLLLAVVLGFAAWSLSVVPQVGFETDLRKLKGKSPATDLDDHITRQLGIIMAPALLHVRSLEDAEKVTAIVAQVQQAGGARNSIDKAASLSDLVSHDFEGKKPELARLKALLDDLPDSLKEGEKGERLAHFSRMLEATPWTIDQVPSEVRRRFSALDGQGTFALLFPRYSGYDVTELELWARDLDSVLAKARAQGLEVHLLDGNRIAAKIFRLVKQDGPFILGCAALVVFLMIGLSLRSLKRAVLVAGPLFIGMTCVFGAMHLFGVKLNFLNVVVLPNLLTIAVDNSVHLYHRYREEGLGSMGHVLRHTGFAAVVATLTNAAGYGAMLVAHHVGLRSIALLAILGVSCTFVGTTLFFPALLELYDRYKQARLKERTAS